MNLNLELVNVTIEMIPRFSFGDIPTKKDSPSRLAKFEFIQSKFLFESFSDGSKSMDLVSSDVLVHDVRESGRFLELKILYLGIFVQWSFE